MRSPNLKRRMRKAAALGIILMMGHTFANADTNRGNGGGAIKREGKVLTFGSLGDIKVIDRVWDVPGLEILTDGINRLSLTPAMRTRILECIVPLKSRQYFEISPEDLKPEQQQQLVEIYAKALGRKAPKESIDIVAVTVGKETYLLPGFFKLGTEEQAAKLGTKEQAAILFHESLWVNNPKEAYSTVIEAEIYLQQYLEEGNGAVYDEKLFDSLFKVFGPSYSGIIAAQEMDCRVNKYPSLTMAELFGKEAINYVSERCALVNDFVGSFGKVYLLVDGRGGVGDRERIFKGLWRDHLYKQITQEQEQEPRRMVYKEILRVFDNIWVEFGMQDNVTVDNDSARYKEIGDMKHFGALFWETPDFTQPRMPQAPALHDNLVERMQYFHSSMPIPLNGDKKHGSYKREFFKMQILKDMGRNL